MEKENLFIKKRNVAIEAWEPRTGSGTEQGEETPTTWPFLMTMDEALRSRPSVSPPVLMSSCPHCLMLGKPNQYP
ncbi:hypothetical protein F7725_028228 [Dissostichus mawsoni]|uniref:Uncharacterized protein n=1 Tax=Dissostichus mawsoni TaxID=36200 RepID=A0A7J5XFE4_DISMA|nr:hypothetical protein F7725_028228 [Dissostichus mawsoni]